jgi:hypothetical protein
MDLGEEQGIHIPYLATLDVLGVIIGLYLPAFQLAELSRPPEELVVVLVHDLVHRTHMQVVGSSSKGRYRF